MDGSASRLSFERIERRMGTAQALLAFDVFSKRAAGRVGQGALVPSSPATFGRIQPGWVYRSPATGSSLSGSSFHAAALPSRLTTPLPIDAMLQLQDLECQRGLRVLFDGVCADVCGGRMLRVQGANGSGKTSLLRMICGLTAPAGGQVRWRGQPIGAVRESFNRELVYIGHAPALKDDLDATENLCTALGLAGRSISARDAAQVLALAGLKGRERLPVRVLSQGQRRRAALARLPLSTDARIWVLDEPFNALDDSACSWLEALVAAQLGRGGVVVLTSHQPRPWEAGQPQVRLSLNASLAQPLAA